MLDVNGHPLADVACKGHKGSILVGETSEDLFALLKLGGELADVDRSAHCERVAETGKSAVRIGEVAIHVLQWSI